MILLEVGTNEKTNTRRVGAGEFDKGSQIEAGKKGHLNMAIEKVCGGIPSRREFKDRLGKLKRYCRKKNKQIDPLDLRLLEAFYQWALGRNRKALRIFENEGLEYEFHFYLEKGRFDAAEKTISKLLKAEEEGVMGARDEQELARIRKLDYTPSQAELEERWGKTDELLRNTEEFYRIMVANLKSGNPDLHFTEVLEDFVKKMRDVEKEMTSILEVSKLIGKIPTLSG